MFNKLFLKIFLFVVLQSGVSPVIIAQFVQQGPKLVGTGAASNILQGYAVSISADGNTAVVGGHGDHGDIGAVWFYTRSGGVWTQLGSKLIGTGAVGGAQQGYSVSMSADGNTAIVGGYKDDNATGAVWIYTQSGGVWTQQGPKLVGTGAVGAAAQGSSVSISSDGNTAIVGGYANNSTTGAAWIFTRSGGGWTQQGAKLTGIGAVGFSNQGYSVSISADGNTAIVGGYLDNGGIGAAWVYVRSGGAWTQQGARLTGTGAVGAAQQGHSVSISPDGNTAIIGGNSDNSGAGAAWVFTRSGGVWTQQGSKLTGTGAVGAANRGFSVSVSSDGNTAVVGGIGDNGGAGAVWIFTRSGVTWTQQGSKLTGTGSVGNANQGVSVSISADGNTTIVGGNFDNNAAGAAWVYTLSGGVWTQQGAKLVGTGAVPVTQQGYSVSISADGNTAIVGGPNDHNNAGAVWMYTRSGGVWTQQGAKLVGTGATGNPVFQGISVCLSADGNTAIVGGFLDNPQVGAAWIYTRSAGVWTQQGPKLTGTGAVGFANQGVSVSISADGNTAIVGGYNDNGGIGAAWIYMRSGGVWTQQGAKLVGTGVVGNARQGSSIAVSGDGNTAIVGGYGDNGSAGAAWVYTRSGGVWTQQGSKLVGTEAVGNAFQGQSVSLSFDGNTAVVGGYGDNGSAGAVWAYTRSGGVWTQQGAKLVGTGATGTANQGSSVSVSSDGNTAVVGGYFDNGGAGAVWVYTRAGGLWTQQGSKLTGSGAVGVAGQGLSVSISSDANTAIVGGYRDDNTVGAAWVYVATSSDANLFNLVTSQGTLSPPFAAGTTDYTVAVPNNITSLTITPTTSVGTASVTVNGNLVASGNPSDAIILSVGDNIITTIVTAQDGATTKTYTVNVTRAPAPPPTVTSFTPATGPPGVSVTITGTNFNATPANNIVFFGAVRAAVTGGSTTSLTVTVPAGVNYKPISVLDNVTGLTGFSSRPFITTFTNPFGTGIPANFYQPKVDFTTNDNPFSVAIGDVDGDGKPDMVVANQLSASVSVFRNTSTSGSINASSFAGKVDFAVGSVPLFVAIGDVDGDGKPDLVTSNLGANTVSVLRNTSTPGSITASSFADKIDFLVGGFPYCVAIGDVDGDGKPDLVAANFNSDNISVLRNTSVSGSISASSFADKVDFATGSQPKYVAIGDLDGDGKPDLVVPNTNSASMSVFRNTSTPGSIDASSFAAKVDFTTGSNPPSVAIGDVDGDGKPDLVVASYDEALISVFRNISTTGTINASSFAAKVDFTAGSAPYSVALGDLDGDGKPDIAVANNNPVTVSVLRNTSTPGAIAASSFAGKVDFATSNGSLSIAVGDVDGDGIPELMTANFGSATVSILKISAPPGAPEINVQGNNVSIVDGDITPSTGDHTDFGNVSTGGNLVRTFTIQNTGAGNLAVSSISITGTDAALFTPGTLTPSSPIGPGGSATFSVTFAPTTTGLKTATVNIASDDADEALYDFAIQGTGTGGSSNSADLSNLVISQGTLTPAFAPGTISYTASVANSVTSLTVTPTLADATATVTVNGVAVADGTPSEAISLNVGSNIITTIVTAQDATTTKTYTINVTRAGPVVTFSGKVFLQGPYNTGTGTMISALNTSGILQANASAQPYNVTGFDYAGTENVAGGFFAAHPEIVDWVLVELRDASTPATIVARRAAFLKQDGNLLETDGLNNQIIFAGVSPGNYSVVIRHRNHLSVMSSVTIDFNSGTGSYDFTTSISSAYAGSVSNPPMATLEAGVFGMYGGNANVDLTIRKTGSAGVNDYSLLLNAVSSAAAPGPTGVYRNEDINMDGNIRKTGSAGTNDYSKLLSIIGALNIITQPAF